MPPHYRRRKPTGTLHAKKEAWTRSPFGRGLGKSAAGRTHQSGKDDIVHDPRHAGRAPGGALRYLALVPALDAATEPNRIAIDDDMDRIRVRDARPLERRFDPVADIE